MSSGWTNVFFRFICFIIESQKNNSTIIVVGVISETIQHFFCFVMTLAVGSETYLLLGLPQCNSHSLDHTNATTITLA